jgi:hypothetical protein
MAAIVLQRTRRYGWSFHAFPDAHSFLHAVREFAAWCALQGFHEIVRAPTASLTERVKNSYESKMKTAYTVRMRFPVVFQAIPPPRDVIGNYGQVVADK